MEILKQIFRYTTVGLLSNLTLYMAYLALTILGAGPKAAMTLSYLTGVMLTFMFNRNWTFKHEGHIPKVLISYISVYAFGYLLNLAGLYFFVDKLGYQHELVQALLIISIALLLFLLQKTITFREYDGN